MLGWGAVGGGGVKGAGVAFCGVSHFQSDCGFTLF